MTPATGRIASRPGNRQTRIVKVSFVTTIVTVYSDYCYLELCCREQIFGGAP